MVKNDNQQERKRLEKLYAEKSDLALDELIDVVPDLTEVAREVLQEEAAKRGMAFDPPPVRRDPDYIEPPLVTIGRFRDLPPAWLAKSVLQSSGIDCLLTDENMIRMNWVYSNLIGGIRLQVREEDVESATEILNQPIPDNLIVDEIGTEYRQPRCPKCNSLETKSESLDKALTYGTWLVLGFPVLFQKRARWKCHECGYQGAEESFEQQAD